MEHYDVLDEQQTEWLIAFFKKHFNLPTEISLIILEFVSDFVSKDCAQWLDAVVRKEQMLAEYDWHCAQFLIGLGVNPVRWYRPSSHGSPDALSWYLRDQVIERIYADGSVYPRLRSRFFLPG